MIPPDKNLTIGINLIWDTSELTSGYQDQVLTKEIYHDPHKLARLVERNSDLISLINYERLCRIRSGFYVICQDFCCGEIWESSEPFCCSNNFKPVRNLFVFLLAALVGLFATIIIFLFVESAANYLVVKKLRELKSSGSKRSLSSGLRTNQSSSSSNDEEIIMGHKLPKSRGRRLKKQILNKHSQSFKDFSRSRSRRRKSAIKVRGT